MISTQPTKTNPDTEAVLAAERARGDALRRGDAAALAAVLSDELRYTHANGKFETKADAVNGVATKNVVFERFATSELQASAIADDVVVLTGQIDQCKLSGARKSEGKLLFQAVWRREGAAWRMVNLQTAIPPAPKP